MMAVRFTAENTRQPDGGFTGNQKGGEYMNLAKLKGKIAESGLDTLDKLHEATKIGVSALSRKMRNQSEFTLSEIRALRSALNLTDQEVIEIFF